MKKLLLFQLLLLSTLFAQLKIISAERISLPQNEHWSYPVFSPDGKDLYITNMEFNGIWQYSLSSKLLKTITTDYLSGYNFSISEDGNKLAYRRTVVESENKTRMQEIVEVDLRTLSANVIDRGNSLSTPIFSKNTVTISENISKQKISSPVVNGPIQILGIEETKIAVLENGTKRIFDPLTNGSYIWPQLSPDRSRIVAVDIERGAFISNIDGSNIVTLGKCNAPQWSRNGNWIIGMDDSDDGHRIISSDIVAISKNGEVRIQLTNTPSQMEMFPSISPIDNRIVICTAAGELMLLTYEEGQ